MLKPVKIAFGEFMGRFYASVIPSNVQLTTFASRGLDKSIVWAPARMIDAAEEMLASWQLNDTDGAPSTSPKMPVIIIAMAKDYSPTMRDYTRQVADPIEIMLPGDVKERIFRVMAAAGDIRTQVVIFAQDEPTAKSLAIQFLLFLDSPSNRRFGATYSFAGQSLDWPVQVESPDSPAMSVQTDVKNLTILAIDITLKAQIPIFDAPADNQPNDASGTVGNVNDPSGYPSLSGVTLTERQVKG